MSRSEYLESLPEFDVPCERCGAKPKERCLSKSGKIVNGFHGEREKELRNPTVKPLTKNERLIWAALYAKEFSLHNPPPRCFKRADETLEENGAIVDAHCEWEAWERQQAISAIEVAGAGISRLRDVEQDFIDGWGEDEDCTVWYLQMIGGDE